MRSYFQESRARDPEDRRARRPDPRPRRTSSPATSSRRSSSSPTSSRSTGPRYNIILRDDKHYPFLKLTTDEEFPRLVVARRVQKDGAAYFGPFYPATAMRETLRLVRQLFPLRTCRIKIDGTLPRPCLQYYIHRCNAPCTGWETREGYARDGARGRALPRGQGRRPRAGADAGDGGGGERGEVRAGGAGCATGSRRSTRCASGRRSSRPRRRTRTSSGVVRQGADACVQLFFVRTGPAARARVVLLRPALRHAADGEVLSAFIRQFYAQGRHAAAGDPALRGRCPRRS